MKSSIQKKTVKPYPKLMIDSEGCLVFFLTPFSGTLVHKPSSGIIAKIGEQFSNWDISDFKDYDPVEQESKQEATPLPRLMENKEGTVILFYKLDEGILVHENIEPNEPPSVGLVTYAVIDNGWKEFNGAITLSNR